MSDLIRLDIDEYGPAGVNGYGLNIELTPEEAPQFPPLIGHFVVTILRPAAAQAHPLKNIPRARKVLTWLARYRFPDGIALPLFDPALLTNALAERNPPGFGYPGTTDWQWYGMQIEQVDCPPLRGRCSLVICQAMPKEEVFVPHVALEAINLAAKECTASNVLSRLRS